MRSVILVCFILVSTAIFGQNYVSGGVLAYHGNAYERSIQDLNRALANQGSLNQSARAKAYYYRGMARIKLRSQNPNASILGEDPVSASLNDLSRARSLDSQWSSRSDAEVNAILSDIRNTAQQEYNYAQGLPRKQCRPIYSRAIERLQIYLDVKSDYPTHVLLAKIYEAYGDVYFFMAEEGDPVQVQRQFLSHYSRAISNYERALEIRNEGSKDIFISLEMLSKRIGDRERESQYSVMASQIGG